jgi:hypothetical protein
MLLAVLAVLAVLTVPLARGRLGNLAHLELRAVWVLAAALVAQIVIISVLPGGNVTVDRILHLTTYVTVLAWVVWNSGLRWRWVLMAGGFANFTVIVANDGVMPASGAAIEAAGLAAGHAFENSAPVADAKLAFLGDVFAIPDRFPLANVFSVGDVLIVLGVFLILHRQCESYLAYVLARLGDAIRGRHRTRNRPGAYAGAIS